MTRKDEEGRKEVAEGSCVGHLPARSIYYTSINDSRKSKQLPAQKVPALRSSPTFPSLMKTLFHSSADLSRLDSHESSPTVSCPEPTSDSPSACSENGNSRITWHSDSPIPSTLAQSTLNSANSAVAKRKVWFRIMLPCRSHALQFFYASNLG